MQSQTYSDFTALVIDDGSTDRTAEYLDSIRDSRFQVLRQSNQGLVAALNRGLKLINAEYVARIDADDVCLPQRLAKQLDFLDRHKEVAVVGSRIGYVFLTRKQLAIGYGRFTIRPTYNPPLANPPLWCPHTDGEVLIHSTLVARMEVLRAIGGYRPLFPGQDVDLLYRVAQAGYQLATLDETLVLFRISGKGVSQQGLQKQMQHANYVRHCSQCRIDGVPEPSVEEYIDSHPLDQSAIRQLRARQRLREAMGRILAGQVLVGSALLARSLVTAPGVVIDKIATRTGH